MLSRRLLAATARLPRPVIRSHITPLAGRTAVTKAGNDNIEVVEMDDPEMNGGYVNPPAIKRQFRDPYADWWDKQERRNFGEPVHEDNDIMGIFSLEEYTFMTPARGFLLWGGFIATVLGFSYAVSLTYPDRPSAPKEYEDGLEAELGGKGAVRTWKVGEVSTAASN